jgi:hypothetical protein
MNRRPRKVTSTLIVGAVVVLIVVLAVVGSKRSSRDHGHATAGSVSTASADHPSSSSSASDPSSHSGAGQSGVKAGTTSPTKSGAKAKTTPTTQPTEIVALKSTSTSATYPVVNASYRLTVTATGSVWVAATSISSESTLWAGILQAGAVQVIRATGTITVQLGTPSASLAVDKVPVIFPPNVHAPFVATFQPTAAATASAAAAAATAAAAGAQAAGSGATTVVTAPTTGSTSPP